MKKTAYIITGALIASMAFAACADKDAESETEVSETVTETTTEETTEETEVTTSATSETTDISEDPVFSEYMMFQDNPSIEEPENPDTIDDLSDQVLIDLARNYEANGYQFISSARDMWRCGSGYCFVIDGKPAFLIQGFWMAGQEGDSQVNVNCFLASQELCEKYLGYVIQSDNGDTIEYVNPEADPEFNKIIFDKTTGVLTITDTVEHIDQGVG